MMRLADLAQLAIAGKNRVAGRRRIVVGESIILARDDGDGHGALQVSAGRAAPAVLPCPQALPRPIARFAERRSGCGPQVHPRTPEGAQGLTTENCGPRRSYVRWSNFVSIVAIVSVSFICHFLSRAITSSVVSYSPDSMR